MRRRCCVASIVCILVLSAAAAAELPSQHHTGDLSVNRGKTVTIEGVDYIQDGNIYVEDGGTLILRDASLTMAGQYSGEHGLYVRGEGKLEMNDVHVSSSYECIVYLNDHAAASLTRVEGFDLVLHDNSTANVEYSNLPNVIIGGGAVGALSFSTVSYLVRLEIDTPAAVTLRGLAPQQYENASVPLGVGAGSLHFSLTMRDTYVAGWMVDVAVGAHVTVEDSQLAVMHMDAGANAQGTVTGLKLGLQANWDSASLGVRNFLSRVQLKNTTITDQWGFYVGAGSDLVISDSLVGLNLCGQVHVRLENSAVPWFCMTNSTGDIELNRSPLPSHMVFLDSSASFGGDATASPNTVLEWSSSSVTRQYTVHVVDSKGHAVPNAPVLVRDTSGTTVLERVTDAVGDVQLGITFTDDTYRSHWAVSIPGHIVGQTLTFLTPSPLRLVVTD
jgi:hypothetical protein